VPAPWSETQIGSTTISQHAPDGVMAQGGKTVSRSFSIIEIEHS
jgi:hypothetical protein